MLFATFLVNAQFKKIAEGTPFDEPENGHGKLLLLKNGHTVFLYFHVKEGIDVQIYDEKHRLKVQKSVSSKYADSKLKQIEAVFECSGDVVAFVGQFDEHKPQLYRLIFDGRTGNLKSDEPVAALNRMGNFRGIGLMFAGVQLPGFYVRKDPDSEHYAVASIDNTADDANKRLQIVFYGPDHKELSRGYYHSPEDKYDHIMYVDMVVIGDQKVCALAYAYNRAKRNGREGELVMANLDAGKSDVTVDELEISKTLIVDGGITRYNPVSQTITLLAACRADNKSREYVSVVGFVNPFERRVVNAFQVYPEKADAKSTELFGRKNHYTGMPQNMFVNQDGSFSIVFEEIVTYSSSNGSSYSELGHIAVMEFDPLGKETGCYFIPKSQKYFKYAISSFYLSAREDGAQRLDAGNQYKSFAYLHGKFKSYVLFNDIEKNAESELKGKITTIQAVSDCDGFYFALDGAETLVPRQYVFGKEDSKRDHNLAIFTMSDYDRGRNIYSTLKLEKEGRSKQVKVVWMEPK